MLRSRSAEQTARVLLSNAVRYDTWECKTSREKAVGPLLNLQLTWEELPLEPPFCDAVALHMTLYDKASSSFFGATYALPRSTVTSTVMFRSRTDGVLLVVELVARDERPNAPIEGQQVLLWGYVPVEKLTDTRCIMLRPGNAQLLQLNVNSWASSGGETHSLGFTSSIIENAAVVRLMTQLVPPGIIMPQSFTENIPPTSASTFRCVLRSIQLSPTVEDAEWRDTTAEWRVAAVAHNGFQQLGKGAEVSLVFDDETDLSISTPPPSSGSSKQHVLHSVAPLEMDGLVVHSTTSLVLAIRRKSLGKHDFDVLGFCVFPLCVMPMQDRDVRVENLPTVQGPFSCRDPRMLMLESASPYGKLPLVVTLTLEYYDTGRVGDSSVQQPLGNFLPVDKKAMVGDAAAATRGKGEGRLGDLDTAELPPEMGDDRKLTSAPFIQTEKPLGVLSTEDHVVPLESTTAVSAADAAALVERTRPADVMAKQATEDQPTVDIFKMLCNIMEELRHMREMQEEAMRHGHPRSGTTALKRTDETGRQLDDAVDIHAVDLSPNRVSISWEVRSQIEENLQPILHPFRGTRLEDHAVATANMTASLYGIRFEGLSVDDCIDVPEEVCFMFSFGSLPFQTIGPVHTACISKVSPVRTFKLYDGTRCGGMVWCEPLEALQDPFMQKYKNYVDATVYIHVYNALTMFYVGSANVKLANFRRPYNAESARIPMDLAFYRDLSLTWTSVPAKVLPVVRNAGLMHLTLFCVGAESPPLLHHENKVVEPPRCSRVIVAKKLPHAVLMESKNSPCETGRTDARVETSFDAGRTPLTDAQLKSPPPPPPAAPAAPAAAAAAAAAAAPAAAAAAAAEALSAEATTRTAVAVGAGAPAVNGGGSDIHWRRAQYVRHLYGGVVGGGGTSLLGLPPEHRDQEADVEFRLRYLEKQRDEIKSRKIAEALMERLTVHHHLCVSAYRPETARTTFQNPFSRSVRFSVEVDVDSSGGALEVASAPSFHLGPHERTEVLLVVRINAWRNRRKNSKKDGVASSSSGIGGEPAHFRARIYTEGREVVRILDVHARAGPPLVDRRYEIFGPPGTKVSKRLFSRLFSSNMFPITSDRAKLLTRMRDMCARITITSELTTADANAVLDPITQTFVTAWEEVTVHTTIPNEATTQRVEYLTLLEDDAMSKVLETWELYIFPCQSITSRELLFGQTTTVTHPSAGVKALYCSDPRVKVEQRGGTYVLHMRPQEVGTQQLLLHALMEHHLAKTLLDVSTVYPVPTYTQTLEFSLMDVTAPIFRRLHFVHHGPLDDVFTVHHNYKYQLHVTPKKFALAPSESQFVTLQIDMLTLPEGQLEGRWPMWIFFNNSNDKTVESYLLHVVLRAHRVVHNMP